MIPLPAMFTLSEPTTISVLLLGMLAGLVSLDDTALAQTWFGQPLPAALMAGYFFGDPLTGLAVGLPLQLVLIGNIPVGQTFTGDPGSGLVAMVGGAILAGRTVAPVLDTGPVANLALTGWLILGAGLLSMLGHWITQAERHAHGVWMQEGHKSLRDGSLARMEHLHVRCLLTTFLRGGVLGVLYLFFTLWAWLPLFDGLGREFHSALSMLPLLLPGLGVGSLLERFGLSKCWPWVGGGMLAGVLLALGVGQ